MTLSGRRAVTYDGITYAPGAQFRVIGEGATLTAWCPRGAARRAGSNSSGQERS